jgi:outer membrane protein assembly factor BamB
VYAGGRVQEIGVRDFVLRAYDRASGELLWEDRIYADFADSGVVNDVVSNGRVVYAVGRASLSPGSGSPGEFAVIAYDAETGRSLWMDVVGTSGSSEAAQSAALRGGQLIVAGSLDVLGTGLDFVVRTYDAETGRLLWDDFVNGTADGADAAADVAVLPHAVYVGGSKTNLGTSTDFFVRGYYKY